MMNSHRKRILGAAIILFAFVSLAYGVVRERSRDAGAVVPPPKATDAAVTAYDFHTDVRCKTCNAIEARTEGPRVSLRPSDLGFREIRCRFGEEPFVRWVRGVPRALPYDGARGSAGSRAGDSNDAEVHAAAF